MKGVLVSEIIHRFLTMQDGGWQPSSESRLRRTSRVSRKRISCNLGGGERGRGGRGGVGAPSLLFAGDESGGLKFL